MGSLDGKIALITGAGAGIGRASALAFARQGARLALTDVDEGRLGETAHEVERRGGEALALPADVSDESQVHELMQRCVARFGRLDCAFNNAGIEGQLAPTAECTRENWDRVLAVNLTGTWLCMREQIGQMLRQDEPGGSIVNNSSVAGLIGFPGLPAYVASKHGIVGLTKTAALEHAEQGIRINAVCPGVIHTEMIDRLTKRDEDAERQFVGYEPMGRMGRPEEVAEVALWLCSDAASFVTGHAMAVDGGFVAR